MAKVIKLNVSTGWAGCDHNDSMEAPESWDSFTEKEKSDFLNEVATDFLHERCESRAWVEDK